MSARVIVWLKDRALVQRRAHATRFEPVVVDAGQGVVGFDVPFRRVEAVLNRLARCGAGEFLAHLTPTPEPHGSAGQV